MQYLLDSNVFIQAKNFYYAHDICPGFWDWLDMAHGSGNIASISSVYDELSGYGDELSKWVIQRRDTGWFGDVSDEATQRQYVAIIQDIQASPQYTQAAKSDFLSGADPWLIAKAKVTGATIITHEKLDLHSRKKVFIPNVCNGLGVSYQDTFSLLRGFSASFVLA